jgi:hypothetical protein
VRNVVFMTNLILPLSGACQSYAFQLSRRRFL